MTDPINLTTNSPRRRWLAPVALVAAFVVGGVTLPLIAAQAQDAGMHAMMGGPGHGGMHAMMMEHIGQMLDKVGATPDQKAKIEDILHSGFASMGGVHADMQQTHARLHALLTAPTIDRNALEQLRSAEIAQIDQASRKMVKAMADAAEVLSPEQRAKLATLMHEGHPPS
jgi:Spy/CpxP family protein refolding chaperone